MDAYEGHHMLPYDGGMDPYDGKKVIRTLMMEVRGQMISYDGGGLYGLLRCMMGSYDGIRILTMGGGGSTADGPQLRFHG